MARLTTLLFAMWLGVTVSTVVDLEKRIVGGHECRQGERQYHVKLITNDDADFCGGSLISDHWILTAAHCSKPGWTFTAHIGVHAGTHKEVRITDPPKIFDNGKEHDLMLLKLPEAVVDIDPVQLPNCADRPNIGKTVQFAGHGATEYHPDYDYLLEPSDTLQCVDMKITDCQELRRLVQTTMKAHYQEVEHMSWLCASDYSVELVGGDSGGGVVYNDRIYGVLKMTYPIFALGKQSVFMDLCYQPYFDWINTTINQQ